MAKHFVIAVGGTGMRCLESLIHLCAAGMFDDHELHILSLETDASNGNKNQTDQLIHDYMLIKGMDQGAPTRNSFFTAHIKFYSFVTRYQRDDANYDALRMGHKGKDEDKRQNKALAELFFDQRVREFDLAHGYRAQTHLGSLLMYHAIVGSARRFVGGVDVMDEDKDLSDFIREINGAGDKPRVFVLGSIFGGTGASSIPVLPHALDQASRLLNAGKGLSTNISFGCSLLTDYFSFSAPTEQQKADDKIVAESARFAQNSQAALSYYERDPTVKKRYQGRYHIGWPLSPFPQPEVVSSGKKVITGGKDQLNPSHIAELMCATAAWDFLVGGGQRADTDILHRRIPVVADRPDVEAADLVGQGNAEKRLQRRLGMLYAFALHVENRHGSIHAFLKSLDGQDVRTYGAITEDDCKPLSRYLRRFAFGKIGGARELGWIFEIKKTVGRLMDLDSRAFDEASLSDFYIGELFGSDVLKSSVLKKKGGFFQKIKDTEIGHVVDAFKSTEQEARSWNEEQNVARPIEQVVGHTFKVFQKLYNFDTV